MFWYGVLGRGWCQVPPLRQSLALSECQSSVIRRRRKTLFDVWDVTRTKIVSYFVFVLQRAPETRWSSPCGSILTSNMHVNDGVIWERGGGQPSWYSCRRKHKRNGRSCGKVLCLLVSGSCATVALIPTVSGSFYLFSSSSTVGARKR